MDDQTLKVVLWVAGGVFALAGGVFTLICTIVQLLAIALGKILWTSLKETKRDVSKVKSDVQALRVEMIDRHPTKDEFNTAVAEIKREMETGLEKLRQSIITLFNKVEKKKNKKK